MKIIDDGGPAFARSPHETEIDQSSKYDDMGHEGMSVRTYAAVKAMAALINTVRMTPFDPTKETDRDDSLLHEAVAEDAVSYADALIARLKTPAPEETP